MPGYQNWFRINVSKHLDNSKIQFESQFERPNNIELNFERASDLTAELIGKNYTNLHLCLSGGLDSEYVAKVLLRNGIDFVPVIVIANSFSNEYWYAKYFCNQHNLDPIIIDYSTRLYDYQKLVIAEAVKICCEPKESFVKHVIAHHFPQAHLLSGFGDPLHGLSSNYDQPHGETLVMNEHDFWFDLSYDNAHPGGFFTYTPDIFYSYARNVDLSLNTQLAKTKLYDIPFRPKLPVGFLEYLPPNPAIQKIATKFRKSKTMQEVYLDRETLFK